MTIGRDEALSVIKTFKVGATAVRPYRFTKYGATDDLVIHTASGVVSTDYLLGISRVPIGYEDSLKYGKAAPVIECDPGDPIDVVLNGNGIWLIELGAAIATPSIVTSDTQGRAVVLAASVPAAPTFCFQLLRGGAAGSLQPVNLNMMIRG